MIKRDQDLILKYILYFILMPFFINPVFSQLRDRFQEYAGYVRIPFISYAMDAIERDLICMAEAEEPARERKMEYRNLWHTKGQADDKPLKRPQGVCLDPYKECIYVADTENDRIMMFDLDGQAIGPFLTSRPVERPFDLVIGHEGSVYISQIGKEIVDIFNKKGVWQASIPKKNFRDDAAGFAPGRMGFDKEGRLMVLDRSGGALWVSSIKKGEGLNKIFESKTDKKGCLLTGLAVSPDGMIYILSAQDNPAITVLNPEGSVVQSFGRHGALYDDSFSFPYSLATDGMGRLWAVDAFRHTVKVFSPKGEYLFSLGEFGERPGQFVYPADIEIDKKGRVYVLEKGAGRLQAFSAISDGVE